MSDSEKCEVVTTVENENGIHLEPATLLVRVGNKYKSKIQMEAKGKVVDIKSALMIISLGLVKGTEVKIIAEGPDAEEAVNKLKSLLEMPDLTKRIYVPENHRAPGDKRYSEFIEGYSINVFEGE
ncbi:MAG: HPr family phosphocarrier protein [Selenomonadaceae bacterium]|nr:HPr family phosphocarrier protein [Selenomonadaceae bacterium]